MGAKGRSATSPTPVHEDDPRRRLGREDEPLRRATLRPAASSFLPLHGASSGNGTILVWLITCDVILWCGRIFRFLGRDPTVVSELHRYVFNLDSRYM